MVSSDPRSGRYPDPNRRPFHRPGMLPPQSPTSHQPTKPHPKPSTPTSDAPLSDLSSINPATPNKTPAAFADVLAAAQAALAQAAARQAYGEPGPKPDTTAVNSHAAKTNPTDPAGGRSSSPQNPPANLPRLAPGQLRLTNQPPASPPIQIPHVPANRTTGDTPPPPTSRPVSRSGDTNPANAPRGSTANRSSTHPPVPSIAPPTAAASHTPAGGGVSSLPPHLQSIGQPIKNATDPRWVLALRSAEALQGPLLTPEKRQLLVRLGKTMGLTAFDANLVIAIIQDQARRGYAPDYCPTAGEPQLQMVPLPTPSPLSPATPARRALLLTITIATVLAAEILFFKWLLGA